MKKILFTTTLLFATFYSFSQVAENYKDKSRFGVRAGINFGNYGSTTYEDFSRTSIGLDIGILYTFHFFNSQKVTTPLELVFSSMAFDSEYREYDLKHLSLNYFVNYYATPNLYFEGGIGFGFTVSANAKVKQPYVDNLWYYYTNYDSDIYNDLYFEDTYGFDGPIFTMALGGGAGYEFNNRVFINARVMFDVMNFWETLGGETSHFTTPSIGIGYSF